MDEKHDATGVAARLQAWAAHPWKNDMSLTDIGLTAVFVVTIVYFYMMLLRYIMPSGD